MTHLIFIALCLMVAACLTLWRANVLLWAIFALAVTVAVKLGAHTGALAFDLTYQAIADQLASGAWYAWIPAAILAIFSLRPVRRSILINPIYGAMKGNMPKLSSTEQEALDAGTVGFDAELFSGTPDWRKLRAIPPMQLSKEEQDFIDGPVDELCRMLDDWKIRQQERQVPEEIWDFVKKHGFLGMLISKEHGGLGFSAQAQSLIVGKISSRSPDVGVVVMVPNSLGPGELIEKFGTKNQKDYFLPRLANGTEVPCFALTGPFAGSDAASMRDTGVICVGEFEGRETVGIRLNWDKRYITLAPNATLLGLAFNLFDPDGILGKEENLGITVALINTDMKNVEIGRRHLPLGCAFPNGPTWGKDVFIPLDSVIGGEERIGQGWRMLMSCLAAGRAISLPATGTAASKATLRMSAAYSRVRRQFGLPIGRMEGVEEALGRIVESAYMLEAGRSVTASIVDMGEKPAVISAIMKYQSTEWARRAINDAMDIHGGKGICDGPNNYLQPAYQAIPVGITVEGANILTRTLIIFGQGAMRSHPYLYKEVTALQNPDKSQGVSDFQSAFEGHMSFTFSNLLGAPLHNLTGGLFAKAAPNARKTKRWYKELSRASRNFAMMADLTVAILAGGLKTHQRITGRMADALSELYLLSCVLKRFEDDGRPASDLAFVELCARNSLYRFYIALRDVMTNFPNRFVGGLMKWLVFPRGFGYLPANDHVAKKAVRLVQEPGEILDRLTRGIIVSDDTNHITTTFEEAFVKSVKTSEIVRRLDRAVRAGSIKRTLTHDWLGDAVEQKIITQSEADELRDADSYIDKIIAVDHFDPSEIVGLSSASKANHGTQSTIAAE